MTAIFTGSVSDEAMKMWLRDAERRCLYRKWLCIEELREAQYGILGAEKPIHYIDNITSLRILVSDPPYRRPVTPYHNELKWCMDMLGKIGEALGVQNTYNP